MANRQREKGDNWRNTPRYLRLRRRVLAEQPLCQACQARGLVVAASELDHIRPVAAGGSRWARANCQGLCAACHRKKSDGELRLLFKPHNVPCVHGTVAGQWCRECEGEDGDRR